MRLLGPVILLLASCATVRASDFESEVAPLLVRRCLECHKGGQPAGGLSLQSEAGLRSGGDSGAVVVAGNPGESILLDYVLSGAMPPAVKGVPQSLPKAELEILRHWIASGAKWPSERKLDLYEVTTDVRGGRDWWAFQPLVRPESPRLGAAEIHNPIDGFIAEKLTEHQIAPAPPADARTIVRRMYYDVTGLPPSLEDQERWSARISAARQAGQVEIAIGDMVDSLLTSPHFGERWGRYWLDLVRYAESSGYERDQEKPFAWKYRDWVVNAINDDKPYNDFIREQLAGDEIENRSEATVIATGFLRLGTWNDEPNDDQDYRYERLEDMVHATSSAFLGLTVKCARCHDHKFDPIPQDDYYRVASVFWPGPIAARDRALLGGPTAEELGVQDVLGWTDITTAPEPLRVLKNGERDKPLNVIKPGSLSFAPGLECTFETEDGDARTTGRRRQLAEWIASPANPLTARVAVNRIWLHHFGEGLVRSPNNFGFTGELPTHPKLLDWLACELISSGWSAKHIHKLILTSRTWRQSSIHPQGEILNDLDATNQLWWRANRQRLDAESLRDSMLLASGELDLRVGGEGFKPSISSDALEGFSRKDAVWIAAPAEDQRRRSLYIYVSRSLMPPMMATFDQCDTTLPCAQRDVTTVPTQALAMMNNDFVHARSDALASRIQVLSSVPADQIELAWEFTLGRQPDRRERQLAEQHLKAQFKHYRVTAAESVEHNALASLCHVLLNSNEFLYID